jgi:hypothetical protein
MSAYPAVSGPYGLKAVNEIGGLPYAGSTRMIPIASGYSSSLFYGQIVQLSGGTLIAGSYTPATNPTTVIAGTIGVFVGCQYTNPSTLQPIQSQYWPTGTIANDAIAYVIDDPRTVFKVAVGSQATSTLSNTSSGAGYMNPAFIGTNVYPLSGAGGSTTTGNSLLSVSGGVVTNGTGNTRVTAAAPLRVVSVVPDTVYAVTQTASTSGSSTTLTLTAANSAIQAGMQISSPSGTGGYSGNYIYVTNVNSTTVTLNSAVTIASGTQVTFLGYPEVLVTWNGNFHSYNNTTGV